MNTLIVRGLFVSATALSLLVGCGTPAACSAIPECSMGETKNTTACAAAETKCRKVEVCTSVIYCRTP